MIERLPAKSRGKDIPQSPRLSPIRERRADNSDIDLPIALTGADRKRASIIGTLSFPVSRQEHRPSWDNSDVISEIIRRRRPGLLLCAGWSVRGVADLESVRAATKRAKTVVVLETTNPKRYLRVEAGLARKMGKQIFAFRAETDKNPRYLAKLAKALPERSFRFFGRKAILLICGEINVMHGRTDVDFHRYTPDDLRDALGAKRMLILNPTHTRMANCGTINAQRRFLSGEERVYVSASNWDVHPEKNKKAQKPSATLHSLWHNGKPRQHEKDKKQSDESKRARFVYREWKMPQ